MWSQVLLKITLNSPVTVALETLGCKLNQAETERLSTELADMGCLIVNPDQNADVYILNTCTVTHIADRKSRHFIRLAHRLNPQASIVVMGCYAERATAEVAAIEGVDLVIGNDQKNQLAKILIEAGYIVPSKMFCEASLPDRTRAFIKAQDGCNNSCSYCIVPLVRGAEKSLPPEQVIAEIRRRTDSGFQEVVLTGTEIGRYRSEGLDIQGLLDRILRETALTRLRLSSLQPEEITSELVDMWQDPRLCRHFHLSLQSGSDSVLKRMNRHYTVNDYGEKIARLRRNLTDVAVTTDLIVGFPGETEAEFEESLALCRSLQFSRLHIFPFSARKGTRAASLPAQISSQVKKERSRKMLKLAGESLQAFNQLFVGRTLEVLFEHSSNGCWTGLTGNYIKAYYRTEADLSNRLVQVKLVEAYRDGLLAEALV